MKQQNKIIITKVPAYECIEPVPSLKNPKDSLILAHFYEGKIRNLSCVSNEQSLTGSVFIARVDSIAPKIHAIFVKIDADTVCYLPEDEIKDAIFTHKPSKKPIAIGDELLVQVVRLPMKTKQACVTTRINLSGHFVVITSRTQGKINVSKKIPKPVQKEIKDYLTKHWETFKNADLVARTNCLTANMEDVLAEAQQLQTVLANMTATAATKTRFTCLYRPEPDYITYIKGCYAGEVDEIITDEAGIFETLQTNRELFPSEVSITQYIDNYPLKLLYSLQKELRNSLASKVWLKSGAYLIIEHTEALTVIDVNSGKKETGKKESYFMDINKEAATEIARQLILRNISGICIVDFIDLATEDEREELLSYMRMLCKKDHITTTVVDFTKLHLMEITRKKTGPTLLQQIFRDIT